MSPAAGYKQRTTQPLNRSDPMKLAAAVRRELAAVTRSPGDPPAEEIERRFQAALREIRWRSCAEDPT